MALKSNSKQASTRLLIFLPGHQSSALERTYLGYLRTSSALVMQGVVISQLFRLQHIENPNRTIGYFALGIPLAATMIAAGILVMLFGAYRTWRQQNAILRDKVHAGGWEVLAVGVVCLLVRRPC